MSEPVEAKNRQGSIPQNASAADGQVPGSSASIDNPPAHNAQSDDSDEDDYSNVCIFMSKVRTDSTITHHIGLG